MYIYIEAVALLAKPLDGPIVHAERHPSLLVGRVPSLSVDLLTEVSNTGVDAGRVSASTSVSPRDNTDDISVLGVDERAATVALAGVDATSGGSGTEHVVGDGGL